MNEGRKFFSFLPSSLQFSRLCGAGIPTPSRCPFRKEPVPGLQRAKMLHAERNTDYSDAQQYSESLNAKGKSIFLPEKSTIHSSECKGIRLNGRHCAHPCRKATKQAPPFSWSACRKNSHDCNHHQQTGYHVLYGSKDAAKHQPQDIH